MTRRIISLLSLGTLLAASQAYGSILSVSPSAGDDGFNRFYTDQFSSMDAGEISALTGYDSGTHGSLKLLFSAAVGKKNEKTPFSGFYSTIFSPSGKDATGFTVQHNGTASMKYAKLFLVVEGGEEGTAAYVFDISPDSPGLATPDRWDGIMDLEGAGFWDELEDGSITRIRFWGAGDQGSFLVPEPGSILVWGIGLALASLASVRRRRR